MPEALGPIGLDPNQIRLQLNQSWKGGESSNLSAESFSQVMWQTVLKECLNLDMMGSGGEGFAGSMYGDWVKEGFSTAIAAQLANQNPLPMPGETVAPGSTPQP